MIVNVNSAGGGIVPVNKGGTGATTATQARTNLGITAPNWSDPIAITLPYTVPEDGIISYLGVPSTSSSSYLYLTANTLAVMRSSSTGGLSHGGCFPVNKGDVIAVATSGIGNCKPQYAYRKLV